MVQKKLVQENLCLKHFGSKKLGTKKNSKTFFGPKTFLVRKLLVNIFFVPKNILVKKSLV